MKRLPLFRDQALRPRIATQAPLAQLDRASDFESEGQRFESFGVRHITAGAAMSAGRILDLTRLATSCEDLARWPSAIGLRRYESFGVRQVEGAKRGRLSAPRTNPSSRSEIIHAVEDSTKAYDPSAARGRRRRSESFGVRRLKRTEPGRV